MHCLAISFILCIFTYAKHQRFITIDEETLGGQVVFKGTRVPIETLFDYLEEGISLNEFLAEFDTVSKAQAIAIMEIASKLLSSKNIIELYDSAA